MNWRTLPGFVRVGATGKSRGIHGELKFYPVEEYLQDVVDAGFLFLERDGNKVPLEIVSVREVQDILITFGGVNDPTTAADWSSCEAFLPSDEVSNAEEPVSDATEGTPLSGYMIVDERLGRVGEILRIEEYPQQEMAVVQYADKEVLIPLTPAFVISIDHEQKILEMDLPEGLLEL